MRWKNPSIDEGGKWIGWRGNCGGKLLQFHGRISSNPINSCD